jgi:hypothetical protein
MYLWLIPPCLSAWGNDAVYEHESFVNCWDRDWVFGLHVLVIGSLHKKV